MYWRRVPYDLKETVGRLQSIEALSPASLAIRLQKGR